MGERRRKVWRRIRTEMERKKNRGRCVGKREI